MLPQTVLHFLGVNEKHGMSAADAVCESVPMHRRFLPRPAAAHRDGRTGRCASVWSTRTGIYVGQGRHIE